jgi:crotonobetainyl-CoA:carnitine CoA-transferase CaiB-like acyl-CoA transferase
VAHRKLIKQVEHLTSGSIRIVGPPWTISDMPTKLAPPPALGQHTAAVLQDWLGMDACAAGLIVAEAAEEIGE